MTKKLISLALALMVCLSLAISAMAANPTRVEITVESEDSILEFYNSLQFDPNESYSFTYPAEIQPRILCPDCGYNTYKGYVREDEGNVLLRECPTESAMESDILVEMITYSYSFCTTCDYKTKEYYQGTKYKVTCSLSPAGFWARPGQTIKQGYDVHECYSSWGL